MKISKLEKVIKGLECCTFILGKRKCNECPYQKGLPDNGCYQLQDDFHALLKEQEAVTPYIDIDEAKCPICKVKLTWQELLGDDVLFEDFFDYCPHCGRSVKWE